jgi:predicted small integral membrane protein
MLRILKILAAFAIGLIGLLAFLANLLNLDSAHSAVSAVISAPDQPYYKIWGPTFGAAWQGWLGLTFIMAGELAAGIFGVMGGLRMTARRTADAADFQAAKTYAIAGGMIGALVWYGFFITVGELYFHMWQTEIGLGSVEGALRYGTVCAVLALLVASRDD